MRTSNSALSGKLFVFEGSDGVGKTTIAQAVAAELRAQKVPCEYLSFPGREDGTIGHLVYRVHHNPEAFGVTSVSALALQALHVAAHVDTIERRIRPALSAGRCVILDRFWWSTWVYGRVAGIAAAPLTSVIDFERVVWNSIQPAAVFVVSREMAGEPALISAYKRLVARERARGVAIVRIRNDESVEAVRDAVIGALTARKNPSTIIRPRRSRPAALTRRRG
jgi:dTMP kinase